MAKAKFFKKNIRRGVLSSGIQGIRSQRTLSSMVLVQDSEADFTASAN